jgi:hypothetical protein
MFGAQYAIEEGYLELILGPMFSGKTTRILEIYNHYSYIQKRIIVINYAEDKRYHETMLSTHDHKMIPCVLEIDLKDMWTNSNNKNYGEFSWKLKNQKSYVNKFNDNDIILFTDAWDVIVINSCKKLYDTFMIFNKDIIFGAEKECSPDKERINEYNDKEKSKPFPYLKFFA